MTSQTSSEIKNKTVAERVEMASDHLSELNFLIAQLQEEDFKVQVVVSSINEINVTFTKTSTEIHIL